MARIAYAWEMGGSYGHLAAFRDVGRELVARGHELVLVLRSVDDAGTFFDDLTPQYVQAPLGQPRGRGITPVSFAEQLLACGYDSVDDLVTRIRAWRELFVRLTPALVVFDSAPTALLAARELGVPRVVHDTPFARPPATVPLPPLGGALAGPDAEMRYRHSEPFVLGRIETALQRLGMSPLAHLRDLFDVEETFLRGHRELDPYPSRDSNADYWGAPFSVDTGARVEWPAGDGLRVFAYLRPRSPWFAALTRQLQRLDARVVLAAPGLSLEQAQALGSPRLQVHPGPVRLEPLLSTTDVALCNAGLATTTAFLLASVPVIGLPDNYEQELTARRLALANLGRTPEVPPDRVDYPALIAGALEPSVRAAAKGFADRNTDSTGARSSTRLVNRIEALLGPSSAP